MKAALKGRRCKNAPALATDRLQTHTGIVVSFRKIFLLAVVALGIAAFFWLDLGRFLSLEYLKQSQQDFSRWYGEQPALVVIGYFAIYVLVAIMWLVPDKRIERQVGH